MSGRESTVTVGLLFPDLLGTYGDSGNAVILAQRLRWRGIEADVRHRRVRRPGARQLRAVRRRRRRGPAPGAGRPAARAARRRPAGPSRRRWRGGAGRVRRAADPRRQLRGPGRGRGRRAGSGRLRHPAGPRRRGPSGRSWSTRCAGLGLPPLSGYENHAGVTSVGPGASPSGRVRRGVGNGDGSGADGVWAGRVFGTYLHGPVLARNPALADLLLQWAVGDLAPLDDREEQALRAERLAVAGGRRTLGGPRSWQLMGRRWRLGGRPP